jgi:hypothetical protein
VSKKTYDIVSVDWNPQQTKLWRYHIGKTCPTANVITIPDNKPIPWNWSSGKIDCFGCDFRFPERVIYLDTDTIVQEDLEPLFDRMGEAEIGISSHITPERLQLPKDENAEQAFGLSERPTHYSSGFVVLKGWEPKMLQEGWFAASYLPALQRYKRSRLFEEYVFSYFVAYTGKRVWEMGPEIHGNILRKPLFDKTMVIHYHKPERLKRSGLGGLLCVE